MTLPNLPTKHIKHEANFDFRTEFEKIKHLFGDAQFENKHTRGSDKFYLRELKPKQRKVNKGLLRLSVATTGTADFMNVVTVPLFIVIKYPKHAYIIPIENMPLDKVYLTEDEAKVIANLAI